MLISTHGCARLHARSAPQRTGSAVAAVAGVNRTIADGFRAFRTLIRNFVSAGASSAYASFSVQLALATNARWMRVLVALAAMLAMSACSRTITWEEEVPLNTGETIWVERSMPWALQGGFGNPLDLAMRPTRVQTLRFEYRGKKYSYTGRANVLWIAISPGSHPVLVAPAADYGWHKENTYYCVVPYYVQLEPDSSGQAWRWPERIDAWLYGMPANVMGSVPGLDESRHSRYTAAMRDQRDSIYRMQVPTAARVTSTYKEDWCIARP
jgi:hypothetical protein